MPNYIILLNFTEQGIRNVKDTINRAEAFENAVEKAGGKFLSEYYTFGRYDIVTTVEVPSDESMMSIMLHAGRLGNVRSETMKAIPMREAGKIIEKMSS